MHFGLEDVESVDSIEIQWSTGEVSELEGPFKAGHRYTINRNALESG
jgi:hypothetical protein